MAVIQAIISFIGRTVGKILSALLDWAVVSLFGRVTGNRKLFLWGMMAAAAAWPILLLGVVAPKAALFFFAFVPLSSSVPPGLVRVIWLAAALLVPIAVGVTVAVQSPTGRQEGLAKSVLRGFSITVGLAAAFVVLLVTVPALRVISIVRGRRDTYVPLVTTPEPSPLDATVAPDTRGAPNGRAPWNRDDLGRAAVVGGPAIANPATPRARRLHRVRRSAVGIPAQRRARSRAVPERATAPGAGRGLA